MTANPASPTRRRDERVDFIKGAVLMLVFCDHLEDALGVGVLNRWTLRALGPSDAAEQFVLLSGLVVGLAYSGRLERDSFAAAQWRAVWRAVQIYLGLVLAAAGVLFLSAATGVAPPALFHSFDPGSFSATGAIDVRAALIGVVTLRQAPSVFQILLLYLVLLPLAPGLVWLARRSLVAVVLPALLLYAAVQVSVWGFLNPSVRTIGRMYFHPLAWQFLFVIGLCLGTRGSDRVVDRTPAGAGATSQRHSSSGWLLLLCGGMLLLGWSFRPSATGGAAPLAIGGVELPRNPVVALVLKPTLGPLRLLHALAAAILLWRLIPPHYAEQMPAVTQPWVLCGRYSLQSYLLGAVLTPGALAIAQRMGTDAAVVLLLELPGWLLVMLGAWGRERLRRRQ
jgi:hypothetical protein